MIEWISGLVRSPKTEDLPSRIREAIIRQQDQSEILIGWVQFAVVLTFTALYLVAPAPVNAEVMFDPVPYALGGYFAFTILRLALAHRIRLAAWVLALSVVADMALLVMFISTSNLYPEERVIISTKLLSVVWYRNNIFLE